MIRVKLIQELPNPIGINTKNRVMVSKPCFDKEREIVRKILANNRGKVNIKKGI